MGSAQARTLSTVLSNDRLERMLETEALAKAFGEEPDSQLDFSEVTLEAWLALGFFWILGATVFYQFITRYVFNDSDAWTEEISRYLLIATVFVGAVIGVAKNNHIQVDFFFRFMTAGMAKAVSLLTDVLRIVFLGCASWMTWALMQKMDGYQMTVVNLPMNLVYGVVLGGFAAMCLRSIWVLKVHWQRGYSALERPESEMSDR